MLDLSPIDALLALALLVIPLALSLWRSIGVELNLLLSFGRSLIQLIVLAYLLALAWSLNNAGGMLLVLGLLWLVSTQLLSNRIDLEGIRLWAGLALLASLALSVGYGLLVVLRPEPWYLPQLWLPLGSAVLVQGVNSGAIAANQFSRALQQNRGDVEMHLSLGASPAQAASHYRRGALRAGILPNLGTVAIAGLGSLPLFMGGLLASGIDPLEAVILELLLVLMLITTSVSVSIIITLGVERLSFNPLAQLKQM